MPSIQDRLRRAEDDFLSALYAGGQALTDFDGRWEALVSDVEDAEGTLDVDTIELAHATALRLAVLTDTSIDILAIHDSVTSDLMLELDSLMSELHLSDLVSPPSPSSPLASLSGHSHPQSSLGTLQDSVPVSRKRSRDPEATADRSPSRASNSSKRLRSHRVTNSGISCSSVSSPSSPPPSFGVASFDCRIAPSIDTPPRAPVKQSRKRRLSDADAHSTMHPAKRLYCGPRIHAVSESYAQTLPRNALPDLSAADVDARPLAPARSLPPFSGEEQRLDPLHPETAAKSELPPTSHADGTLPECVRAWSEEQELGSMGLGGITFDLPAIVDQPTQKVDLDSLLAWLSHPDASFGQHLPTITNANIEQSDGVTSPATSCNSPILPQSPSSEAGSWFSTSSTPSSVFPGTPPSTCLDLGPLLFNQEGALHCGTVPHSPDPSFDFHNPAIIHSSQTVAREADDSTLLFGGMLGSCALVNEWDASLDMLEWPMVSPKALLTPSTAPDVDFRNEDGLPCYLRTLLLPLSTCPLQ